jgi:hypothetical protein
VSDLRKIDAYKFALAAPGRDPGRKPELKWLPIDSLRIDSTYQRIIADRGAKNVRTIAAEFDWAKFAPVIVAKVQGGVYAIIDGQHRATAAAARGIKEVPCQIVEADHAKQASAFAAINAQVTAVSSMQLHAARIAAGDSAAKELSAACAAADVIICRYPVPADKMKPGETLAVGSLASLLKAFGRNVLVTALCCITKTRTGNVGMIRAPVVTALCRVLDAEPDWAKSPQLIRPVMERFDFYAAWAQAGKLAYAERCSITVKLVEMIGDHIETNMSKLAA